MTAAAKAIGSRTMDVGAWANLLVAIVLLNGGNLLLDDAAKRAGVDLRLFFSPLFVAAIASLGLAFFFYVRSLGRLPLAVAYPVMVGVSMIVVAVTNNWWHEPLSDVQLLGVGVLFGGVALISSNSRTT